MPTRDFYTLPEAAHILEGRKKGVKDPPASYSMLCIEVSGNGVAHSS